MSRYRDAYDKEMLIQAMNNDDDISLEDVPPVTPQNETPESPCCNQGVIVYTALIVTFVALYLAFTILGGI